MSSESELAEKLEQSPPRLQEIITEFREATPRERLDYLLDFAMNLPDLPARLIGHREQMEQVHECQTPVFLHTELNNGHVEFYFDIPRESPTVRGYASLLVEGFENATPTAVLETPDDVYLLLGLQEVITPQRVRGLHALLAYMKRQVQKLA
jgi:cysteine desulfuration protein SufE